VVARPLSARAGFNAQTPPPSMVTHTEAGPAQIPGPETEHEPRPSSELPVSPLAQAVVAPDAEMSGATLAGPIAPIHPSEDDVVATLVALVDHLSVEVRVLQS
jgi:hypothetical protein